MGAIYISLCIGGWGILVISLTEDLIFGDRGRKGAISEHFAMISGNESKKDIKVKVKDNLKQNNSWRIPKKNKIILLTGLVCVAIFFTVYLAFKSMVMSILIGLLGMLYPKITIEKEKEKRNKLMDMQLIDALNSIRNSMKAGLSVNSAFIKCSEDLERLYSHKREKPMLQEFKKIKKDLNMGIPMENVLKDFSNRVKTEDVDDLVNSIIIVRQKGGNIVEVINNISSCIIDKISIKKEIEVLTTAKRFEAKIVSIIPVLIILLISIVSPNYMEPLYGTTIGKTVIIFGIILLVANYFVNKKIVDIKV
jgi:tight adherence protein B